MFTPDSVIAYYLIVAVPVLIVWAISRRPPVGHWVLVVSLTVYVGLLIAVTFFPLPVQPAAIELHREMASQGYGQYVDVRVLMPTIETVEGIAPRAARRIIGGNLALLAPLGFLLPFVSESYSRPRRTIAAVLLTSLGIEVTQLAISLSLGFPHRTATVDDLLLNTAGGGVGWLGFRVVAATPWLRSTFAPFLLGDRPRSLIRHSHGRWPRRG